MPRWLTARRCVLAGLLTCAAVPRAAAQAAPPAPAIEITLTGARDRWRETVRAAAEEAAAAGRDWLGAHPTGSITAVAFMPPVWQGPGAMFVEQQVAAAVVRSWWPPAIADGSAAAMLDGFARYLQGHAVERLYARRFGRAAHRAESIRMFGDALVWSVPQLRRSRWSAAGISLPGGSAQTQRDAAVFATLERLVGVSALQGAMFEVARMPPDHLNRSAIVGTISDATGWDLAWLFASAADPAVTFDYAAGAFTSSPADGACPPPCFVTTATARRLGDGVFSGRTGPRDGGFDSGDAIDVRVTFANGQDAWTRWDGRDESRTFEFAGPSPATAVHVDPRGVVQLDANPLNNAAVQPAPTNVPVRKWVARWLVWMQHAMLTYGFIA